MVNTPTNSLVEATLKMSLEPLDITEIARRCGVAYNTVKKFVNSNPNIHSLDGYPLKYECKAPGDSIEDSTSPVEIRESEDRTEWLERIRHLLPVIVALPAQASFQDRLVKARDLDTIGLGLLEIAKNLRSDSNPNVRGPD